jgi:hypothetical protein
MYYIIRKVEEEGGSQKTQNLDYVYNIHRWFLSNLCFYLQHYDNCLVHQFLTRFWLTPTPSQLTRIPPLGHWECVSTGAAGA